MTDTLNADDRQDYLISRLTTCIKPRRTSPTKQKSVTVRHAGKVLPGSLAVTGAIVARLLPRGDDNQRSAQIGPEPAVAIAAELSARRFRAHQRVVVAFVRQAGGPGRMPDPLAVNLTAARS